MPHKALPLFFLSLSLVIFPLETANAETLDEEVFGSDFFPTSDAADSDALTDLLPSLPLDADDDGSDDILNSDSGSTDTTDTTDSSAGGGSDIGPDDINEGPDLDLPEEPNEAPEYTPEKPDSDDIHTGDTQTDDTHTEEPLGDNLMDDILPDTTPILDGPLADLPGGFDPDALNSAGGESASPTAGTDVPEPLSLVLLASGLLAGGSLRRKS